MYVGNHVNSVLITDNATWNNQLIEDTVSSKRAWPKGLIVQWLLDHNITGPAQSTKAELLELVFDNLAKKHFVVDETANKYNVDILWIVILFQSISP